MNSNAIFINDHIFYTSSDKDSYYTSGTLDSKVWERFTNHFGSLTVIGRGLIIDKSETSKHQLSSINNVTFDLFYNIKGGLDYFKYKNKIRYKLEYYIKNANYIIIRLPSIIGIYAAIICKKYKKKYLVEVVGNAFDSLWYYGSIISKIAAPISNCLTKKSILNSSAAVYVTETYLQKKYPTNSPSINASNVVLGPINEIILEKRLKQLDSTSIHHNFGMIGNIELSYKGFEVLFKALATKLPFNYKLYIIGGGKVCYINRLIQKYSLEDNIVLAGRINDRQKLMKILDSLTLYIQPSLTEGLPRSVIEAMSRACPIIASDAGGMPELIDKSKIYKAKSYIQLRNLIISTIGDKNELKKMSKENFYNSKKYQSSLTNSRRSEFFENIKNILYNP